MQGDGGTKADPLPQFRRCPSALPGWDRVPSCAVWWPGVTLLTTRADAVYSTNSSLLLLLWFVIPHNAATQPELIILTKYTDSGDSHRHQPPSRAQHSLYADVDWTCTMNVHTLLSGKQCSNARRGNPPRWFEIFHSIKLKDLAIFLHKPILASFTIFKINNNVFHHMGRFQICAGAGNFEEKPSSFSLDILENSNITAFCPPPVQGGCSVWYNGLYLPSVGNNTTFRMFTPHKSWPSSAA